MKRRLKAEEAALWERVKRSVAPLRASASPAAVEAAREASDPPASPPSAAPIAPPAPPKPKPPRVISDLDRKTRRMLARGGATIDGRIDLHGLTEAEAHAALVRFIAYSQAEGRRVVLVITGKGSGGEGRGVLRRAVPHWLAGRDLARLIVSFGPAHQTHGGDGALYVRLRAKG